MDDDVLTGQVCLRPAALVVDEGVPAPQFVAGRVDDAHLLGIPVGDERTADTVVDDDGGQESSSIGSLRVGTVVGVGVCSVDGAVALRPVAASNVAAVTAKTARRFIGESSHS